MIKTLVIDVGNTNIVLALYEGDIQQNLWRIETHQRDGLEDVLTDINVVDCVVVGSVVPSVNDDITQACEEFLTVTPVFITYENAGIEIDLDTPSEVGADRLINAVCVLAEYSKPAIIVDFGTATTFDVVDDKGQYAGGVIAPGINLSLKALEQAAAKLPDIKIEQPKRVIGKNTVDAMQSGIYWGYIGLIEGTIERIEKELGHDCLIIATGGLAPLFAKGTDKITKIDGDLTLKGLIHINKAITKENETL